MLLNKLASKGPGVLSNQAGVFLAAAVMVGLVSPLQAQAQAEEVVVAKIEVAETSATDQDREFYGRVVAVETVDLAFQVGGQIVDFPVIEGAPLEEGAFIAELDPVPFELALAEATARFDQALRTYERLEQLSGNTVSQATLDDAQTDLDLARVHVDQAQRSLDQARLTAPFDALVSSRLVANQSTVAAATPIVRLHNMSEVRIEIDVPEVLFLQTQRNPDISLWALFPNNDERYPLEIREFNAETASVGQTYTITLGMAPPDDLLVLPGASAEVQAHVNNEEAKVTVLNSALVFAADGSPHVLIFEPVDETTGVVHLTPVEITPGNQGEVIVQSGLEPGQEYVAAGPTLLEDGQTVTRFTAFGE